MLILLAERKENRRWDDEFDRGGINRNNLFISLYSKKMLHTCQYSALWLEPPISLMTIKICLKHGIRKDTKRENKKIRGGQSVILY
jgi:hypothetical protein